MKLSPYLFMDGTCLEAMNFYKSVFGGELKALTYGKQLGKDCPPGMEDRILHAILQTGDLELLASDTNPQMGQLTPSDSVNITMYCDSPEQLDSLYNKLSEGGKPEMPPHDAFWGARFGQLKDKYGFSWMLNFDRNPKA